ncbi:hypothetical protein [Methylomicrobium sp. Wu6]|uniref:hypothetical protein n=1 Tax=Methylomicrobium sp. Wu6 TaxID=3107928 RepID=UPI002DD62A39|nr:hypothetical protein [Methylomicrobium sp. Wu6]MEC4749157.1 hypothetical protein [Methylomicrobium sp. Wu6]
MENNQQEKYMKETVQGSQHPYRIIDRERMYTLSRAYRLMDVLAAAIASYGLSANSTIILSLAP